MGIADEVKYYKAARAKVGTLTDSGRVEILRMVDYFSAKGGGVGSQAITSSPLCGGKHTKRTRSKRAKQIRASHVPELQAAGLLPLGSLFWLWWSSPIGWTFLLNWIMEILSDNETSGGRDSAEYKRRKGANQ